MDKLKCDCCKSTIEPLKGINIKLDYICDNPIDINVFEGEFEVNICNKKECINWINNKMYEMANDY